jgi:DNA (cytosine-5)-methyltransferase 1
MIDEATIAAVDLFCGVGGLTHGLERAGVDVRLGVDNDVSCEFPFEANNRARFKAADVLLLSASEIQHAFGDASVRLLAGCAPCQPFSTYARNARRGGKQRRGRGSDGDWALVGRFAELVQQVEPELVTMENVPPLVDQEVFKSFVDSLCRSYAVTFRIVECRNIGLPQTRKRLVLFASKLGSVDIPDWQEPESTVRATIGDLPKIGAGGVDPLDSLHKASKLSLLNQRRIKASKPGGTWRDWPDELRAACHQKLSGTTYPSVYGRMEWDAQAPTITTQAFGYGNGRFGHPEQDRAISLREAAMLQGFPRNYLFAKPTSQLSFATLGRLIGNAVPVPLGEMIGKLAIDHVAKNRDRIGVRQ